jgi:hypothetical protein
VPHRVGQPRGDLGHQDVQLILVVHLEDLGHQPGAHGVGLTTVAVDYYFHEPVSLGYLVVQTAVVGSRAWAGAASKARLETNRYAERIFP